MIFELESQFLKEKANIPGFSFIPNGTVNENSPVIYYRVE
jgi:hypothetical protein